MVKNYSDSEKGNLPPPPHGLLFPISTDRIAHTTAFVTTVVAHWLERELAQWVHHKGSIRPRRMRGEGGSDRRGLIDNGARRNSVVERLLIVRWVIGSTPPSSCISQCCTTGVTKDVVCTILFVVYINDTLRLTGKTKKTTTNKQQKQNKKQQQQKEAHEIVTADVLSSYLSGPLPCLKTYIYK